MEDQHGGRIWTKTMDFRDGWMVLDIKLLRRLCESQEISGTANPAKSPSGKTRTCHLKSRKAVELKEAQTWMAAGSDSWRYGMASENLH